MNNEECTLKHFGNPDTPVKDTYLQRTKGGAYTTFGFDIQIENADLTEIATTSKYSKVVGLAPDQPQYRILVVEDRLENRLLLMKMLSRWGFQEVREATNGQEALDILKTWQPDLIWMDMQMPVMNGYEATKRIKANPLSQKIVIIALTASAFEEDRQEILQIGCDDFVLKPFQEQELLVKMEKYLGVLYLYQKSQVFHPLKSKDSTLKREEDIQFYLRQISGDCLSEVYQSAEECSDEIIFQLVAEITP
ncbi:MULTISPECIES: response regulator [Planktothricoides]|uniref:Response regulator n=2 Tax=Planktothricoides raciborskii TaxID=132608 RepID=A0AAU8JJK4_9CYAN|nr:MULTISPECIES: response regulator [Planktothricoides]KOR36991.1 hypothetical protein AM228_09340 [Planktothricoides sp. SR001]MBD2545298.1 response regulator [Planktothricoides raciborskii FACHB-1370]MBD2584364.1 response regulator [Planktothricoides raciborskii FACHB-1261]